MHKPTITTLVSVPILAALTPKAEPDAGHHVVCRTQFRRLAHAVVIGISPQQQLEEERIVGVHGAAPLATERISRHRDEGGWSIPRAKQGVFPDQLLAACNPPVAIEIDTEEGDI